MEQQVCIECNSQFDVLDDDLQMLTRLSPSIKGTRYQLPSPKRCPDCRMRRRMSFRNERNLYSRKCSKSGAALVSCFSPRTIFPVYESSRWWGDDHDATSFGKAIDWSRPILEQIRELQRVVPRPHTFNYADDRQVNSRFTNCAGDLKDCYLIFGAARNERCMYSNYINDCYACVDNFFILRSNNCYECIDVDSCNTLFYSQSCNQCYDSYFLYDCRGCNNCIGCVGLRQKQYHIFNKEVTKSEYERQKQALLSGGRAAISGLAERFQELLRKFPRRAVHGDKNENSSGDFIWNTKNCYRCYDTSNAWDCRYCTWYNDGKDSMDCYAWGETELCYEISSGGDNMYGCCFTMMSWGCRNCQYLDMCAYSKNCIACVGLKNKEYCILNREYSKTEYEELSQRLIQALISEGVWGEHFPAAMSPVAYNESVAQSYYALTKPQALELGHPWSDYESPAPSVQKSISGSDLPDSIGQVGDDILEVAVHCVATKKPFRVVKQELDFYREHHIPIPRLHPDERHRRRLHTRNPRKLWSRFCENCGTKIESSYSPDRSEVVFCDKCYLEAVY